MEQLACTGEVAAVPVGAGETVQDHGFPTGIFRATRHLPSVRIPLCRVVPTSQPPKNAAMEAGRVHGHGDGSGDPGHAKGEAA